MLNNINTAIDSFQGIKTKFVETCVKNEELKKPLNQFIEAQSSFAKIVAKAHVDFYTSLGLSAYTFDAKKAFALTKQNNVAVIAKIPLDSGWLTGKYDSNSHFTGVRSRWTQEEKLQRSKLVDRVKEIVGEKQSLVASALSFCTSFEEVSTVIPGAISKQQLIHNIEAMRNPIAESTRNELVSFYENEVEKLNLPW